MTRDTRMPHDGGLQPQTEAAATGSAPEEALQALGTHLAEGSWLMRASNLIGKVHLAENQQNKYHVPNSHKKHSQIIENIFSDKFNIR